MKYAPIIVVAASVWATSALSQGCLDPYLDSTAIKLSFTETAETKPIFKRVDGKKLVGPTLNRGGNGMSNAVENQVSQELRNARGGRVTEGKTVKVKEGSTEKVTVTFTVTPSIVSGNPNHLQFDIAGIEVANDDALPEAAGQKLEEKIDVLREQVEAMSFDLTKVSSGNKTAQTRLNSYGVVHVDSSALFAGLKGPLQLDGPTSVSIVKPANAYSGDIENNSIVKGHPSSLYDYLKDLETKLDHRDKHVALAIKESAQLGQKVKACQPVQDLYATLFRGPYDSLKDEMDAAKVAVTTQEIAAGKKQALANANNRVEKQQANHTRLTELYKAKARYVADHASSQPIFGDHTLTGKRPITLDDAIQNLQNRKLRIETELANRIDSPAAVATMSRAIVKYEGLLKTLFAEKDRYQQAVLEPITLGIRDALVKTKAARVEIKHLEQELGKAEEDARAAMATLKRMRPKIPEGPETAGIRRAAETMLESPSQGAIKDVVGAFESATKSVEREYKSCTKDIGDRLAEIGRINHEIASLQDNIDGLKLSAACLVRKHMRGELAKSKQSVESTILSLQKDLSDALGTTSLKGYSKEEVKKRIGLSEDAPKKHRPADAFDAVEQGLKFMAGAESGGITSDIGWGKFSDKFSQYKGVVGKTKKYSDGAVNLVNYFKAMSSNDPQFLSKGLKLVEGFSGYVGPHTAMAAEAIIEKGVRLNDEIRKRDGRLFLKDPSKNLHSRHDIESNQTIRRSDFDKAKRDALVIDYQILRFQKLYGR
jgi:hypothetical protein